MREDILRLREIRQRCFFIHGYAQERLFLHDSAVKPDIQGRIVILRSLFNSAVFEEILPVPCGDVGIVGTFSGYRVVAQLDIVGLYIAAFKHGKPLVSAARHIIIIRTSQHECEAAKVIAAVGLP